MAIFNQSSSSKRETAPPPSPPSADSALKKEATPESEFSYNPAATPAASAKPVAASRPAEREAKESLIASDLTIEGKIEGAGHIRIAGRFKGDVHVQGDLTIEHGAKLTGGVRARKVTIAGELDGNIEAAERVELLDAGVMVGDVKAGVLIVAAGSKMRGQVEFGWDEKDAGGRSQGSRKTEGSTAESGASA
ncbi:bactofilin family protein [Lysobacter sp. D1-1-M9]|uniref:bactofilin family protein n=1 Tax=Novilysobacter longmucuonensis TaxID=3098603 RepID=UPI002FC8503B